MQSNNSVVAILDAGAQYGKVIDRKIRSLHVKTDILPLNVPAEKIKGKYAAIVISGGPQSVNLQGENVDLKIFDLGIPILGICYGMQLIAYHFNCEISNTTKKNYGPNNVWVDLSCSIFDGLTSEMQTVLLSHGDCVKECSENITIISKLSELITGIQHKTKPIIGLQFHPEVDLTINGLEIFRNFLFKFMSIEKTFYLKDILQEILENIKLQIGNKKVLCLVSGGIDSTVCLVLLQRILKKEQIIALHINNGMMRMNESETMLKKLKNHGISIEYVDACHTFYCAKDASDGLELKFVILPELKRKIIGDTFIHVVKDYLKSKNIDINEIMIVQGTLRPDLIESASNIASDSASVIKTHHNDTELVRNLRNRNLVVEPLKDFHKDEVRNIGKMLGLEEDVVHRHPFPGPGLAIRIICADKPYFSENYKIALDTLSIVFNYHTADSDKILPIKSIISQHDSNLLDTIFSTLENKINYTLLPINSVGVQGDNRTYRNVLAVSADIVPDWEVLDNLARIIPNIIPQINRVCFAFGSKIKDNVINSIVKTTLTENVLEQTRIFDFNVNKILSESGETIKLSQMPIVMIPINFDQDTQEKRSFVIRPFITSDFMTGIAAKPDINYSKSILMSIVEYSKHCKFSSKLLYDLSSKPPGTTEWE